MSISWFLIDIDIHWSHIQDFQEFVRRISRICRHASFRNPPCQVSWDFRAAGGYLWCQHRNSCIQGRQERIFETCTFWEHESALWPFAIVKGMGSPLCPCPTRSQREQPWVFILIVASGPIAAVTTTSQHKKLYTMPLGQSCLTTRSRLPLDIGSSCKG